MTRGVGGGKDKRRKGRRIFTPSLLLSDSMIHTESRGSRDAPPQGREG